MKHRPLNIAFDIDDTLWKIRRLSPNCTDSCVVPPKWCVVHRPVMDQVPDYDLIQVLRWFHSNGDNIFFWSAGGMDYCQTIITKLGLDTYGTVIGKKGWDNKEGDPAMDIAFDDAPDIELAKMNITVNR